MRRKGMQRTLIAGLVIGGFLGVIACLGSFLWFSNANIQVLRGPQLVFVAVYLAIGAVIGALAGGTSGSLLWWIRGHSHRKILFGGLLFSGFLGAIACSGPFLLISIENPEYWGEVSILFAAFLIMMGAVTGALAGGAVGTVLASLGGRIGSAVRTERGEAVGVSLGMLAGAVIGGLVSLGLAIIGIGITA